MWRAIGLTWTALVLWMSIDIAREVSAKAPENDSVFAMSVLIGGAIWCGGLLVIALLRTVFGRK